MRRRVAVIGLRCVACAEGGVESAVTELSARLPGLGWDPIVYVRDRYQDDDRGFSYEVRSLPALNSKHLESPSHSVISIVDAIRRDVDLVHLHAVGNGLWSWLPVLAGLPVVVTIHGLDWERAKWGGIARRVLRSGAHVSARFATELIGVSREVCEVFSANWGRTVHFIPNAAPELAPQPDRNVLDLFPHDRGYFLFLGRLVPEKGVDVLIRAFREYGGAESLVIVGGGTHSGSYESELRSLAEGDGRIYFLGPRHGDEKVALLRSAAGFLMPSLLEGMPLALLEAMECGVPCVVADLPALREIVDAEVPHAIVVPPGDADSLREAFDKLRSPASARMASSARDMVRSRYAWDDIARQVTDIYQVAMRGRGRSAGGMAGSLGTKSV